MPRRPYVANCRRDHLKYAQELARLKKQLLTQSITETQYNEEVEFVKRQQDAVKKSKPQRLQQKPKKRKSIAIPTKNDPLISSKRQEDAMNINDGFVSALKTEYDPLEISGYPIISANGFSLRPRGSISYDIDVESDDESADKTYRLEDEFDDDDNRLEDEFNDDDIFEEVKKIRDSTASSLSLVIKNCQEATTFLSSFADDIPVIHLLPNVYEQKQQLLVVMNVAQVLNQTLINFMAPAVKMEEEPVNGNLICNIKNENCQTNERVEGMDSIDYKTNNFDDHKIDMNEIMLNKDSYMFNDGNPEIKEEKVFYCDYCEKSFRSKYFLVKHSKCHSSEINGSTECKVSNVERDINLNTAEVENYEEEKLSICKVCSKHFASVSELNRHSYETHITEGFYCHDCSQSFPSTSKLNYHKKHVCKTKTEKICQYCGLVCTNVFQHLKFCKLNVDNVKVGPFICDPCGKEYPTLKQLEVHTRNIHTKAGLCPECGEKKIDVKNHIRRVHLNEVRFTCPEQDCKFTCFSKQHLKRHKKLVHENSHLNCPKCGKLVKHIYHHLKHAHKEDTDLYHQFTSKTGLFSEWGSINYHHEVIAVRGTPKIPFKCDVCKKEFITKSVLENHLLTHATEIQ